MKTFKHLMLLCGAMALTAGCDKGDGIPAQEVDEPTEKRTEIPAKGETKGETQSTVPEGVYEGTRTVNYHDAEGEANVRTGDATVTFEEGKFRCEHGGRLVGYGDYSVVGKTITFTSDGIHTADFDWTEILAGEYGYTLNGDKLTFGTRKRRGDILWLSATEDDYDYCKYDLMKK